MRIAVHRRAMHKMVQANGSFSSKQTEGGRKLLKAALVQVFNVKFSQITRVHFLKNTFFGF